MLAASTWEEMGMASVYVPSSIGAESLGAGRWRRWQNEWVGDQSRAADTPPATAAQRLELVREHGDFSLAYTTAVQAGLKIFRRQSRLHRL